jgi:hypothetical protein
MDAPAQAGERVYGPQAPSSSGDCTPTLARRTAPFHQERRAAPTRPSLSHDKNAAYAVRQKPQTSQEERRRLPLRHSVQHLFMRSRPRVESDEPSVNQTFNIPCQSGCWSAPIYPTWRTQILSQWLNRAEVGLRQLEKLRQLMQIAIARCP